MTRSTRTKESANSESKSLSKVTKKVDAKSSAPSKARATVAAPAAAKKKTPAPKEKLETKAAPKAPAAKPSPAKGVPAKAAAPQAAKKTAKEVPVEKVPPARVAKETAKPVAKAKPSTASSKSLFEETLEADTQAHEAKNTDKKTVKGKVRKELVDDESTLFATRGERSTSVLPSLESGFKQKSKLTEQDIDDEAETSVLNVKALEAQGDSVDEEGYDEESRLDDRAFGIDNPKTGFDSLGLDESLLQAVRKMGYKTLTEIQSQALPVTLLGKDVAGFAQTGTGKTAVFLITVAQRILTNEIPRGTSKSPSVLVVVPTRELAVQIESDARALLSKLGITSFAVYGGTEYEKQSRALYEGVDILAATTGRLIDLHKQKILSLDNIRMFVCDEVDRMFDMGFVEDVEYLLSHLAPTGVQKLLFSATGGVKVRELAFEYLENPEYIESNLERLTPEAIVQWSHAVPAVEKFQVLLGMLKTQNPECAVVFCNTKVVSEWVGYKLAGNGFKVDVITGDINQNKRLNLIKRIKNGELQVLVATDVVSRGLHVANLTHVYNFDVPEDADNFVHRIGRTARAGAKGTAVTLVCEDYGYHMGAIEDLLGFKVPVNPLSEELLAIEDVSDYPFDEQGRVRSISEAGSLKDGHKRIVVAQASRDERPYESREKAPEGKSYQHRPEPRVAPEAKAPVEIQPRIIPASAQAISAEPKPSRFIISPNQQAPQAPVAREAQAIRPAEGPARTEAVQPTLEAQTEKPAQPQFIKGNRHGPAPLKPRDGADAVRPEKSDEGQPAKPAFVKTQPAITPAITPALGRKGPDVGRSAGNEAPSTRFGEPKPGLRRDEKAKETAEGALAAARSAAAKRKGRPAPQREELSSTLSKAKEELGSVMSIMHDKIERFVPPALSGLFAKLSGFGNKKDSKETKREKK